MPPAICVGRSGRRFNISTGGVLGAMVGIFSLDYVATATYMTQMNIMSSTGDMATGSFDMAIFEANPSGTYTFLYYSSGDMNQMMAAMGSMTSGSMMSNAATMGGMGMGGMDMGATSSGSTATGGPGPVTTMNMASMMLHAISMGPASTIGGATTAAPTMQSMWYWNVGHPKYTSPNQFSGGIQRFDNISFPGAVWLMASANSGTWGTWVPWVMMAIIVALTLALVCYLVFSIWGYKAAFDAQYDMPASKSNGMVTSKDTNGTHSADPVVANNDGNID